MSSTGAGAAADSSAGAASAAGASSGAVSVLVSSSGAALAASPSLASVAGVSSLVSLAAWPFSSGLSSVVGEVASSFPSSLLFLLFFSEIPLNLKEFFRENFFFFLPSLAASPSPLATSASAAGAGSIASPALASPSLAGSAVPFPSAAATSPSGLADTSPLVLTWPFSCRGRG